MVRTITQLLMQLSHQCLRTLTDLNRMVSWKLAKIFLKIPTETERKAKTSALCFEPITYL